MKTAVCLLVVFALLSLYAVGSARETPRPRVYFESSPHPNAPLPPDLAAKYGTPLQSAAVADTFVLHFADFDGPGMPDPMGYLPMDLTAQLAQ